MNIETIEAFLKKHKKLVIAIDGPSGAGKSTLSAKLEEEFNALVLHTDDYFLHPSRKTSVRLSEPGGNLDYERMEKEIFSHINDEYIPSHNFNCMTNELEHRKQFRRKDIIIIEGVYSMHPRFLKYYDYTIFLDISRESQYSRILKRSNEFMLSRFKKEWIPLEDLYFDTFKIKEEANIIIKND